MRLQTWKKVLIVSAITISSGCSGRGYFIDRARDTADIFTLTAGLSAGAGARVGPLHAGLGCQLDLVGLRGGLFAVMPWPNGTVWAHEVETTAWSNEKYVPLQEDCENRHKNFVAEGYPLISIVMPQDGKETMPRMPLLHPYYTQLEVFAGLVYGVRVGFNPGELIDFLLGWTTLDIYNDDLGSRGGTTTMPDR